MLLYYRSHGLRDRLGWLRAYDAASDHATVELFPRFKLAGGGWRRCLMDPAPSSSYPEDCHVLEGGSDESQGGEAAAPPRARGMNVTLPRASLHRVINGVWSPLYKAGTGTSLLVGGGCFGAGQAFEHNQSTMEAYVTGTTYTEFIEVAHEQGVPISTDCTRLPLMSSRSCHEIAVSGGAQGGRLDRGHRVRLAARHGRHRQR